MSAAESEDIWDHWAENYCDGCDKRIHANAGALCVRCALDFRLADDPWLEPGVVGESPDEVFALRPQEPKPMSETRRSEAEIRRRIAAGFSAYHARESKEGSP